jgi:hypothetical protein
MAASDSVEEVYERLEDDEVMLRTDRAVVPTMMKGGTVSLGELDQLRRIENVVRLGRVERIENDQIVLEQGSIPTTPGHLHVHCAASGLSDSPPREIFADHTITLQLVTRVGLTLSGALQGFLETTGRTTEAKNALCPPTTMPHTPFDYLRVILAGISTEMGWQEAPDLQEWVDASRLNLLSGWAETRTAPLSGNCSDVSSPRCFLHSTSCRCSRHRPRHKNERGCSNRLRPSAPERTAQNAHLTLIAVRDQVCPYPAPTLGVLTPSAWVEGGGRPRAGRPGGAGWAGRRDKAHSPSMATSRAVWIERWRFLMAEKSSRSEAFIDAAQTAVRAGIDAATRVARESVDASTDAARKVRRSVQDAVARSFGNDDGRASAPSRRRPGDAGS